MKNYALAKDLKDGVFNDDSLIITKGNVGNFSIEVENSELNSIDSYLYEFKSDRDSDFVEMLNHKISL
jgi:hypothetical protein